MIGLLANLDVRGPNLGKDDETFMCNFYEWLPFCDNIYDVLYAKVDTTNNKKKPPGETVLVRNSKVNNSHRYICL